MKLKFALIIWCCAVFQLSFSQKISRQIFKKLHYCRLPGVKDSVLCGTVPVFENRKTNKGRIIELNVIVVPALKNDSLLPPIFDIDGGPGFADTKNAMFYADPSFPYRLHHDIVLVDVRGTGKSNSLYCPSLQGETSWSDMLDDMYPVEKVKACYEELSKRADLSQYTTINVVKDLEDVRKFLGFEKIDLFSLSYGGRVAQVYLKLYPSSIEKAVLWSPATNYSRVPLYHAEYAQKAFEQLVDDCRIDSLCSSHYPNFEKEFRSLKEHAPFNVSIADSTGKKTNCLLSWNAIQTELRSQMYTPQGLRMIPYLVHQLFTGNYDPFLKLYGSVEFNKKNFAEGFYLCVTCSEDIPFIKKEEIDPLTRNTFMGTYRIDQQKQACANWVRGDLPKDFLEPVRTNLPVLILSGGFDPVTPPSTAKEILSHLPNGQLVLIPFMSHMFEGLTHIECFDKMVIDFYDHPAGWKVDESCVQQMKPPPYKINK